MDRPGVIIDIVRDIEFRPVWKVICRCGSAPIRPRDKPRLVKPWLPPALPAIAIEPRADTTDYEVDVEMDSDRLSPIDAWPLS